MDNVKGEFMKYILMALFLLPFSVYANELSDLKGEASSSIDRQMRALKSSKSCIDTAQSVKQIENCNYNSANFKSEIQEQQEQPDTGTHSEATQTHGY
jgi:hypothetical protein